MRFSYYDDDGIKKNYRVSENKVLLTILFLHKILMMRLN
jgi:hypothetical protein